ncbi:MAG TPA: amino acid permease [Tepidisphaeraceae bacterium]|nr:amino acid permease [Tepidisphaeraceae bacterium]
MTTTTTHDGDGRAKPQALSLLVSERPRNVNWFQSGALLFGDWGTSRLYVLGLAFLVAGRSSFWLIAAMSLLILAVGWAYTHICRLYPDGGGVYTAGRRRARILGVIGALLLFADYTVTASLSAVEAFHYFGLGQHAEVKAQLVDPGDDIRLPGDQKTDDAPAHPHEKLLDWRSPGLWAIISIVALGAFNLLGPKHSAAFAMFAAAGMIFITVFVLAFALPGIDWSTLSLGRISHPPGEMWRAFVFVVLALSGVEAIANLTGVMKKPVYATAKKAIWVVAIEVAVFNLLLALVMCALASQWQKYPMGRDAHTGDMLAFIARSGGVAGQFLEWPVRIIGGLLLLAAANTAVNGLMSIIYVMSRDGELPAGLQKLNGFGAPWMAAFVAAGVPAVVLLFFHDLTTLASLYAIGVVGAVALDCVLAASHPRLRSYRRKGAILALGAFLIVVWVTLAFTKWHATVFVSIVMAAGLLLRAATQHHAKTHPKPSLLRRAIMEQLTPEALAKPKLLLATAGSDHMAEAALARAKQMDAALVVCFIRSVSLDYRVSAQSTLTFDTDLAAQKLFADFLEHGHKFGVPIIPNYDTGPNPAELIAEIAAINGVQTVLIGTSRRGVLHHFIKGRFQQNIEAVLPPDIKVEVIGPAGPWEAIELPGRRDNSGSATEGHAPPEPVGSAKDGLP